jgi:hypothetical protein
MTDGKRALPTKEQIIADITWKLEEAWRRPHDPIAWRQDAANVAGRAWCAAHGVQFVSAKIIDDHNITVTAIAPGAIRSLTIEGVLDV